MIAAAVNCLVIEPIGKIVSASTGSLAPRSRTPNPFAYTISPARATVTLAPRAAAAAIAFATASSIGARCAAERVAGPAARAAPGIAASPAQAAAEPMKWWRSITCCLSPRTGSEVAGRADRGRDDSLVPIAVSYTHLRAHETGRNL